MPDDAAAKPSAANLSMADFFSAAEARRDRWSQLQACAEAWRAGAEDSSSSRRSGPCWTTWSRWRASGPTRRHPDAQAARAAHRRGCSGFASAAQRIKSAIFSGAYRRDAAAWSLDEELEGGLAERIPPGIDPDTVHRPYFEVLTVLPESARGAGASARRASSGGPRTVRLRRRPHLQLRGRGRRDHGQRQHAGGRDLRRLPVQVALRAPRAAAICSARRPHRGRRHAAATTA